MHLAVGSDGVVMALPHALELQDADWQDLATVPAQLWPADEGWTRQPPRGRLADRHATALDGLRAASLDRVAGGPIEPWLLTRACSSAGRTRRKCCCMPCP